MNIENDSTVHIRIMPDPDCIHQFNKSHDFQNSQSTIKMFAPLYLIVNFNNPIEELNICFSYSIIDKRNIYILIYPYLPNESYA